MPPIGGIVLLMTGLYRLSRGISGKPSDNDSFIKKAPKNIVKESNDILDDLLSDQVKLGESKLFINKLISHGK